MMMTMMLTIIIIIIMTTTTQAAPLYQRYAAKYGTGAVGRPLSQVSFASPPRSLVATDAASRNTAPSSADTCSRRRATRPRTGACERDAAAAAAAHGRARARAAQHRAVELAQRQRHGGQRQAAAVSGRSLVAVAIWFAQMLATQRLCQRERRRARLGSWSRAARRARFGGRRRRRTRSFASLRRRVRSPSPRTGRRRDGRRGGRCASLRPPAL